MPALSSTNQIYHLLEFACDEKDELIVLDNATYSIGRDPSNSIVINSSSVSRQHAILLRVTVPDSDQHLFQIVDGSLSGKKSTNGVYINGKKHGSYVLKHGDEVALGGAIRATYYNFYGPVGLKDPKQLKATLAGELSEGSRELETVIVSQAERREFSDLALLHLATFPELIPNPIIEVSIEGTITYLNPKANSLFPDIRERNTDHPVLGGVTQLISNLPEKSHTREVEYNAAVYEESIHYIKENDLIRIFLFDITEKKQAELARFQAEKKYRSIFLNAVEGLFQTTLEGTYLTANPKLAQIYGYGSAEELISQIGNISDNLYVEAARRDEFVETVRLAGTILDFESQVYRKDGSIIWISENARAIYDESHQCIGFEGSVQDITDRKIAETELLKRDRLLKAVSQAANRLLTNLDFQAAILSALSIVGEAIEADRMLICSHPIEVKSESPAVNIQFDWASQAPNLSSQSVWQGQTYTDLGLSRWFQQLTTGQVVAGTVNSLPLAEKLFLQANGWQSVLLVPLIPAGSFWGFLGVVSCQPRLWSSHETATLSTIAANIGGAIHRQQIEDSIRHRALHDVLTGLPNRMLFDEQLDLCLKNASRTQEDLAVMFLDLDRFKTINDTLGHTIGDQLLQLVAQRLEVSVRAGDVVARWGGDEFIILLPGVKTLQDVNQIAERIIANLDNVFTIDSHELYVTGSIGIASLKDGAADAETLIKRADIALYRVKELGRNGYQVYHPSMDSRSPEILILEKDLRHALGRNELRVVYQPRVNISSGEIDGMEALIRWQHPEMGLVGPNKFIPIAEDNGLIIPIGEWVLRQACAQNKHWQKAGLRPIRVSVNLSPKQFRQPNLVKIIADILCETQLDAHFLELEVTETTAINDIQFTGEVFQKLEEMGVQLSIDDFGTGHSSLSRLQFLPLNHLKIDKSFIQDLTHNQKVSHIISTIVALGKSLGLSIVAEGVETVQQLDFLKSIQCETAQGFFFYRPISADEATRLLENSD
ncbi:MAG: EAL domain-containing protein [Cyanobacteria bacterium Co-bin13]|nr:EAL domain-containing protein [Cyanobacteria bacterium Co-bin13]